MYIMYMYVTCILHVSYMFKLHEHYVHVYYMYITCTLHVQVTCTLFTCKLHVDYMYITCPAFSIQLYCYRETR